MQGALVFVGRAGLLISGLSGVAEKVGVCCCNPIAQFPCKQLFFHVDFFLGYLTGYTPVMESPEKVNLPPDDDLTEMRQPASLLVAQFFLFPLIIIAICAGIFLFFGYLSYETRTPEQYLGEIRSGSETQRWQAAF